MSAVTTMFWMGLVNLFFASRFMFQLNLYAGLIVMCGFVLYDTQLIIEKRRRGDADFIWFVLLSRPSRLFAINGNRFHFSIARARFYD